MALIGFKLLWDKKHVSPATTLLHDKLGEDICVTGKTPKKLVQVVQELHATVDIYFLAFAGGGGIRTQIFKIDAYSDNHNATKKHALDCNFQSSRM